MHGRFLTLDGLRGVAALIVMEMHAKRWFDGQYLQHGYLAVDFFFMLSGFVIAHAYGEKIRNGLPAKDFAAIRVIRLYPLYAFALVLTALLVVIKSGTLSLEAILSALFLLPVMAYANPSWFVPSSWSLFFELLANGFYYPLARSGSSNRALACFWILGLILLVCTAALYGSLDAGFRWSHIMGGFARVCFSFTTGIVLYRIRDRIRVPLTRYSGAACLAAFVILVAFPTSRSDTPWYEVAVVVLAFPLIIATAQAHVASGRTVALYDWLGRLSYPVYITHAVIFSLVDEAAKAFGYETVGPAAGAAVLVAVVALGTCLDRCYDAPVRRFLTSLWRSRENAARQPGFSARPDR